MPPREARGLSNLPGVQCGEQGGVDEQGLWIAHQLGDYLPTQGLQEAPELAYPPVQGGRVKPYHPREQVREEPLGIAQEGTLGLHATKLLQVGEGDDLRVRELLKRFVAPPFRVEQSIGVVDEAEHDGEGLFRSGEALGMVGVGHLLLLREGRLRWPPFYPQSTQHTSSVDARRVHG